MQIEIHQLQQVQRVRPEKSRVERPGRENSALALQQLGADLDFFSALSAQQVTHITTQVLKLHQEQVLQQPEAHLPQDGGASEEILPALSQPCWI